MGVILSNIITEMIFWMAWIIIPLIIEILPAFGGFIILVKKKLTHHENRELAIIPDITVIVPVYNSSETLQGCIDSIHESTYPDELIDLILVDNGSRDNSFQIYTKCQKEFPALSMRWMTSQQGKSKALNLALFNSVGKYIIHIDSDGKLHPDALKNMVIRFEQNSDVSCMTGVILTDYKMIETSASLWTKLLQRCEFYEYAQAFLAGRNFESELNSIYTLSGAFSAFRKSTVMKTQMYNSETVGEDTQITFQIRYLQKQKVNLCENSFFMVDPIENFSKLYTQRQRWQRGELEVSHMFMKKKYAYTNNFRSNFMVRLLLFDHTFAFPRMIWYFALIFLLFMNYPFKLVAGSIVILYLLYVFSAFLFFLVICGYLSGCMEIKRYYVSKWYYIILLPVFNFMNFWIRFAAIINSIKESGQWKTRTLREEWDAFRNIVKKDFSSSNRVLNRLRAMVNK